MSRYFILSLASGVLGSPEDNMARPEDRARPDMAVMMAREGHVEGRQHVRHGGPRPATDFDKRNVDLLYHVPGDSCCGGEEASDIWGYTSAETGKEYAIITYTVGLSVVEITTGQAEPRVITAAGWVSPRSIWKDVKVYGHYAYLVTEADGQAVVVFNLKGLDTDPPSITATVPSIGPEGGGSRSHNIVIDEVSGYMYRVGGSASDVTVYDLKGSEGTPRYVTSFGNGYVHDAHAVTIGDRQLFFAATPPARLEIWDVTDKGNIGGPGGTSAPASVTYSPAVYSHNVWVNVTSMRAYLADEGIRPPSVSGATIYEFDVANLANPRFLGTFNNDKDAITHNHMLANGHLYGAEYATGLRVFDVESKVEVAHFDTFPDNDDVVFAGAWGVHAFDCKLGGSGKIIVADVEGGLYVLEDRTRICGQDGSQPPATTATPTAAPTGTPSGNEKCNQNGKKCISPDKAVYKEGEEMKFTFKGASATKKNWHVAVTKEGDAPLEQNQLLTQKTKCADVTDGKCKGQSPKAEGTITMSENKPKEGGVGTIPLAIGNYAARLMRGKTMDKTGPASFTVERRLSEVLSEGLADWRRLSEGPGANWDTRL